MSFLRLIFASAFSIFFPPNWFYKSLSEERDAEERDMHNSTRAVNPLEPSYPQSRPRRRLGSSSKSRPEDASRNRNSWRQSMSFGAIQSKVSWIPNFLWGRDGRRREGKTRVEDRTLPPLLETQDEPRIHDDRSRRLFQDRLDLCAETDIIKECEALNDKFANTVLSLVDEWSQAPTVSRRRGNHTPVPLITSDQEYLQTAFGATLFRLIRHSRSSPPSINLQDRVADALQALAVFISFRIISQTFCPGLSQTSDVEMQETFKDMLSQEPRATALRWRALTYVHSNRKSPVEKFTADYVTTIAHYFSATFMLAGEKDSSAFLSRMREAIAESEVVEYALRFSEKLKTSLFSVHLDAYFVEAGLSFREDTMDSSGQGQEREVPERSPVLCTVELGLREITSGYTTREAQGRILLKPKVMLEQY